MARQHDGISCDFKSCRGCTVQYPTPRPLLCAYLGTLYTFTQLKITLFLKSPFEPVSRVFQSNLPPSLAMAGPIRQPIDIKSLESYLQQQVPEIKTPLDVKQVNSFISPNFLQVC